MLGNFFLFVFMASGFVWDFRPLGQRLFDLISLAIAGFYLLFHWRTINFVTLKSYIIPGFILLYCLYGFVTYGHKSSIIIAVMYGLYILLHDKLRYETSFQCLKYIYIINLAIFFFQLGGYHGLGIFVDFQVLFGMESRIYYNNLVRPVGIFSEPHTYCISVVLLSMMTLNRPEMRKLHLLGSFSLLVSLSLWGMVVGLILPLVTAIWERGGFRLIIKRYSGYLVILILSFVVLYGGLIQSPSTFEVIGERIVSVWQDKSLKERFATHEPKEESIPIIRSLSVGNYVEPDVSSKKRQFLQKIFGHGISTYPFLEGVALNSYAFIFHAGGAFGILILLGLIYLYWVEAKGVKMCEKLGYLALLALVLTSYPMLSYAFFWVFISLIPLDNSR